MFEAMNVNFPAAVNVRGSLLAAREAATDEAPCFTRARRAEAHAALRSVQGSEQAALDAALAVVEGELARLRATMLIYGEALKEIQVYGSDEEARSTAAAALRRAPERLRAPAPVPHLDGAPGRGDEDV